MITLVWYLLKVMICSGILFGYYFLALRNKTFHRWNRFYLLVSIVAALTVPLIKINIFQHNADKGTVIKVLQTISYGDEVVIEYNKSGFQVDSETMAAAGYVMISGIFLSIFLIALFKIRRLKKRFPETKIKDISFINTNAKGTPFSFLNAIFWNNAIDLHSTHGQKIFNHELAHIKEKHSYDKIFLNVAMIFFWANPFFWLIRKELHMIHEFIADKESLEDNDLNAFAEMILQTVYPGQKFSPGNSFFYSPIKRRLVMLIKNKNTKVSYISRLLVLPLAAIIFFAFTIKMKGTKASPLYDGKAITVVIDAGHGGEDNGAVENNIKEKDLTLDIAKQVKELNSNKKINIILTRDNDEYISVKDKINFANVREADLFISIHINKEDKKNLHSGIDILIPSNGNKYLNQSKLLGSAIMEVFRNNYLLPVADNLTQREKGPWVLTANKCPAVLIEAGFITTQKDWDYLVKSSSQRAIARNILNGIENYAEQSLLNVGNINIPATNPPDSLIGQLTIRSDTANPVYYVDGKEISKDEKIPPDSIQSVTVLKGENAIKKYGDKGRNGVIEITTKYNIPSNTFIIIDGKESSRDELNKIPRNDIESVTILKGEGAIRKYGEKAKYGSIEIITKKASIISSLKDTTPNIIFIKVENEASFPGGPNAWQKYIARCFQASLDSFTTVDFGTCILRFIVNAHGTVRDVRATTMKGTQLAKMAINAIKNGPKWIPASQNGHTVASYRLQPVTLTNPDAFNTDITSDKIFTKVENEASFPGGQSAWVKFITKNLQASLDSFTTADFGTCILRFVVNIDGTVSDVRATTMKGTQLAKMAINAIKKGPKWIPASQNGHTVASYRLQPVTLTNPDAFNKTSSKLKQLAGSEGEQVAWSKYITRVIQKEPITFRVGDIIINEIEPK